MLLSSQMHTYFGLEGNNNNIVLCKILCKLCKYISAQDGSAAARNDVSGNGAAVVPKEMPETEPKSLPQLFVNISNPVDNRYYCKTKILIA